MGARQRGRKALLQARYAEVMNGRPMSLNLQNVQAMLEDAELALGVPLTTGDWHWVEALAEAVTDNSETIDSTISPHLKTWSLDRLDPVTKLILEQAVAEVLYLDPPTPSAVAIDEAVELAKIFDSDQASGFVNAVLDSIFKGSRKC